TKPSIASPAAIPNRFCSAMPTWMKRSGKASMNRLVFDDVFRSASKTTTSARSRPSSTRAAANASRSSGREPASLAAIEGLLGDGHAQPAVSLIGAAVPGGELAKHSVGRDGIRRVGVPLRIELGHLDTATFDRMSDQSD